MNAVAVAIGVAGLLVLGGGLALLVGSALLDDRDRHTTGGDR